MDAPVGRDRDSRARGKSGRPDCTDYAYLLEVDLAVEVIEVWSEWRGGVVPTQMQAAQAVIHYAEHDAYEPLDDGWPY